MANSTSKTPRPPKPEETKAMRQDLFNSMSDAQRKYVGDSTWSYKLFISAWSGKSKANAIKAKCIDCCCWQKEEITKCPTLLCPLWKVRPYQKAKAT